jgi:hypothetical protein
VVFGSIDVFDRLAADVQQATISFRVIGKEAEIVRSYRDLSDRQTYPIVSAPSCAFWGPII